MWVAERNFLRKRGRESKRANRERARRQEGEEAKTKDEDMNVKGQHTGGKGMQALLFRVFPDIAHLYVAPWVSIKNPIYLSYVNICFHMYELMREYFGLCSCMYFINAFVSEYNALISRCVIERMMSEETTDTYSSRTGHTNRNGEVGFVQLNHL